jgi:ParB/RepB/Spo0J family partition protein
MTAEGMPRLARLKIEAIKVPDLRLSSELVGDEWEDFKASIERLGIREPISIIQDPDGNFWLEDGGNRLKAARELGYEVVPVKVRQGTLEDAVVGSVIANTKRGRVNAGYLAEFVKEAIDRFGWTQKEAAEKLQLSESYVSILWRVAQDKSVLEELKAGRLTVKEAYERVKARGQGEPSHSLTVKLCSTSSTASQSPPLGQERAQPIIEGASPLTDEDILTVTEHSITGSRGLYKTELELCGYCGKPVAKNVARRIFVHAHEYDKALLALEKAKAEEDHATAAPQTPQAEGGRS